MMSTSGRNPRSIIQPITTLAEFLYNQIELKEFQLLGLIPTDILTENGCMIMADAGLNAWPLICDPTWYSVEWIRLFLHRKKFIIVRYHVRIHFSIFIRYHGSIERSETFFSSNYEHN